MVKGRFKDRSKKENFFLLSPALPAPQAESQEGKWLSYFHDLPGAEMSHPQFLKSVGLLVSDSIETILFFTQISK
jgi:hypothetical protein